MIFTHAFDLHDELVHQSQVVSALFTEVLFANLSGLLLTVFCSKGHAGKLIGEPRIVEARRD